MTTRITASAETLIQQASMTAHDYLHAGIKAIDEAFGEGYAKNHPELLGAFMTTAASDFQTAIIGQRLEQLDVGEGVKELTNAVGYLANSV